MYFSPGAGVAKRITTAESTVIATGAYTAGRGLNLIGLHVNATAADETTVRVYAGITATATGTYNANLGVVEQGSPITGLITFASVARATYLPLPAYVSSACVIVTTGTAGVTLYWNPAT